MIKKTIGLIIGLLLTFQLPMSAEEMQSHTIDIGDFSVIQVIDDINVIYKTNPDSVGKAVFRSVAEAVPSIVLSNTKNKLKIELNLEIDIPKSEIPTLTVYSSFLVNAENWGDGVLSIENPAPGAQFKTRVIGNGKLIARGLYVTQTEASLDTGKGEIILEGTTRTINFKNIGTGTINASELKAESGNVKIYGTGSVLCDVKDELVVSGMGTGKVYLYSNPKVKKRTLGSIDIITENK